MELSENSASKRGEEPSEEGAEGCPRSITYNAELGTSVAARSASGGKSGGVAPSEADAFGSPRSVIANAECITEQAQSAGAIII